jgi:hypothetical protein
MVGVQGPIDAQAPIVVLGVYELSDGDAIKINTQATGAHPPAAAAATASQAPARAGSAQ